MAARVLLVLAVLAALYGCGQASPPPPEQAEREAPTKKADEQKPDKVVANEGLNKEEEKELNRRIEKLEKKVEAKDKAGSQVAPGPPEQSSQPEQQVEDQVRAAAESYYQAVVARDWGQTYSSLDSETRSAYSEEEWFATNGRLADRGSATYAVQSVDVDDSSEGSLANVAILLTYEDGSTEIRNTYFVYEDGSWKHRFGQEEYDLFATTQAGTSSASTSASSSASSGSSTSSDDGGDGAKQVEVVVTSDVPVDVSISDDNLDVFINEEVTGSKTYELDVAADSGLSVSATNMDMSGNVSIEVYENGQLKTQDSDSSGTAIVTY